MEIGVSSVHIKNIGDPFPLLNELYLLYECHIQGVFCLCCIILICTSITDVNVLYLENLMTVFD